LYASGRQEGALLSVLVAVAATARRRYPRSSMGDREAFTTFSGEEMFTITGCVGQFNIRFRAQMMPLQDLLYRFVRCELAHEAELPGDVAFEPGEYLLVNVDDDQTTFSDRLLDGLVRAVENAPENADLFGRHTEA
jgi:hypothetical protein